MDNADKQMVHLNGKCNMRLCFWHEFIMKNGGRDSVLEKSLRAINFEYIMKREDMSKS